MRHYEKCIGMAALDFFKTKDVSTAKSWYNKRKQFATTFQGSRKKPVRDLQILMEHCTGSGRMITAVLTLVAVSR